MAAVPTPEKSAYTPDRQSHRRTQRHPNTKFAQIRSIIAEGKDQAHQYGRCNVKLD